MSTKKLDPSTRVDFGLPEWRDGTTPWTPKGEPDPAPAPPPRLTFEQALANPIHMSSEVFATGVAKYGREQAQRMRQQAIERVQVRAHSNLDLEVKR